MSSSKPNEAADPAVGFGFDTLNPTDTPEKHRLLNQQTPSGAGNKRRSSRSDSDVSRPSGAGAVTLTLKRFTELGGVQTILGDYLDQTVTAFPEPDQPHVRTLLGTLVSSGGVKQRLPLEDISRAADLDPQKAAELLDELTRLRLLQRYETTPTNPQPNPAPFTSTTLSTGDYVEPPLRVLPTSSNQQSAIPNPQSSIFDLQSSISYELTHDYLVPRITRWLGQDFWDAQHAREIIRQDFPAWLARQRLLALDDLKLLNAHQPTLRLTPAEAEMVFASAVAHDEGSTLWEPALSAPIRQHTLLTLLTHPDTAPRAHAAASLNLYPDPAVSSALAQTLLTDDDPAVRQAAIASLAHLTSDAPKTINQPAIDSLVAAQDNPRARAALIGIRDVQPGVDALLPGNLRGPVFRQVAAMRFQRHRGEMVEMILQGLQGGFLALGLGMGVFFGLGSAQDLSILPVIRILGLIYFGVAVAGVLGATAGSITAGNQATFRYILDGERPFTRWLSGTTLSAGVMAISFLFFSAIFPGEPRVAAALGAGALIGAGLTAPAIAPYTFPWGVRLGVSAVSGVVVFLAANPLLFNQALIWPVLMGLAGGIGFFLAFNGHRKTQSL